LSGTRRALVEAGCFFSLYHTGFARMVVEVSPHGLSFSSANDFPCEA
jgi:hypothetical protein